MQGGPDREKRERKRTKQLSDSKLMQRDSGATEAVQLEERIRGVSYRIVSYRLIEQSNNGQHRSCTQYETTNPLRFIHHTITASSHDHTHSTDESRSINYTTHELRPTTQSDEPNYKRNRRRRKTKVLGFTRKDDKTKRAKTNDEQNGIEQRLLSCCPVVVLTGMFHLQDCSADHRRHSYPHYDRANPFWSVHHPSRTSGHCHPHSSDKHQTPLSTKRTT